MSSTSSAEQTHLTPSATEILASRYRHLFVLPSTPLLVLYAVISSLLMALLSRGIYGLTAFIPALAVFVLSGSAISSAMHIIDKNTIATFRRAQALVLAGETLWLGIVAVGSVGAWVARSSYPLTNAFLFGAFVCAGLEFLIVNGAFARSVSLSLTLAAVHPAATILVVRLPEVEGHFDPIAAVCGLAALAIFVGFPWLLKGRKTSLGHDALSLFQAFMKAWTAGESAELEGIIADHSEEEEVTTKVLRFGSEPAEIFLVFPGVHPGPFYPIGSYDMPGVISRGFKGMGPVMTLHRPGGHERNLATRAETTRYASMVVDLARSMAPADSQALIRGPIRAQVGQATVSASAFNDDLVLTISFAPLGSDDLDTQVETGLAALASESGFQLSVVDAHNSIDRHPLSPALDDPEWRHVLETAEDATPEQYGVAYAHSNEIGFTGRGDLTENGLGVFMVRVGATKHVLVLADANNSIPQLRGQVAETLGTAGYNLIEFCTSDSHNLAARGLTVARGYEALGEATPAPSIAEAVVKLAKLAETRLAPAKYRSAQMTTKVRVFGSKALDEFAAITQASSKLSSAYLRYSIVVIVWLFLLSVIF